MAQPVTAPLAPPHAPAGELPRLSRIRLRLVAVALAALAMLLLAVTASFYSLAHEREVRRQYEDSLAITHLSFDAESLASRMRAMQEISLQRAPGTKAGTDGAALRTAVRSLDADRAEWERRAGEVMQRDYPDATRQHLVQLQMALRTLRLTIASPALGGLTDVGGLPLPAGSAASIESIDRDYLTVIEAAQAALLASVRTGGERAVIGSFTPGDLATALVIGASGVALLLGGALIALLNQAQHENRAALGIMGELLRTDPLTGITNRRGLDENLPVEMARARRGELPLAVAMLDLDYFKRYNSRRGHAGGDSLLRTAAQSWRRQLRPTDMLARYGGEEFTLVLPNCDTNQACQLIARLRPLLPDNQTFSAGVALWDFQESGEQLLRRADQALLTAKKNGRNRTVVSGQEEQIALPLTAA